MKWRKYAWREIQILVCNPTFVNLRSLNVVWMILKYFLRSCFDSALQNRSQDINRRLDATYLLFSGLGFWIVRFLRLISLVSSSCSPLLAILHISKCLRVTSLQCLWNSFIFVSFNISTMHFLVNSCLSGLCQRVTHIAKTFKMHPINNFYSLFHDLYSFFIKFTKILSQIMNRHSKKKKIYQNLTSNFGTKVECSRATFKKVFKMWIIFLFDKGNAESYRKGV